MKHDLTHLNIHRWPRRWSWWCWSQGWRPWWWAFGPRCKLEPRRRLFVPYSLDADHVSSLHLCASCTWPHFFLVVGLGCKRM